ncbi:MAG TPA: hypothetical protein VLC92_16000 [Rhodocyclaceae bacterium]|nr:hypothetical protein [Rhodocyclaceae bacterium]
MPARLKHPAKLNPDKPDNPDKPREATDETLSAHNRSGRSLPHELDETPDAGLPEDGTREVIKQAARDVRRGLRDTERRGVPSDVPGPSDDPQRTRGADVQVHGKRR